ncbi:MAG: hypothetical protein JSR21_16645, partial [Proteobacteria bacterium]|nr:hypothetical protein [Pseudomonadota bacterium]
MRRLAYGLLGTALLFGQAHAADRCASQADRDTFDLAALKSEMMVLATSCHQEDRYNAVIQRFKPELLANEKVFDGYFKRVYGRSGQSEHDSYVTSLANAQSDVGMRQGTDFCPHSSVIFDEALAVPNGKDLVQYAAAKDLIPENLGACVGPVAATKASATHS